VEVVVGDAAVEDLDAAELDDAVAETGVQPVVSVSSTTRRIREANPASGVV